MSGASLPPGTRLGVYEVTGPIGAGGMGEVYQARDTKLNRTVALKILPPALASDADRLARFRREAQVLAALNHPNIAVIYGVEDSSEPHALVMEFVPGQTLAEIIGPPVALDETLQIVRQIASALEAAHEQGIIHRDLKPANVKVTEAGAVKVLDFGLAKDTSDAARARQSGAPSLTAAPTMTSPAMTEMGVILGTAGYMAPEQAKGRPVDRRADIWALGVVLYEMLSGVSLYRGETVTETIAHVITQPPDWSKLPASTPAPIRRLLRRMLEKDPRSRMQSAGDVRVEIDEYLAAPQTAGAEAAIAAPPPTLMRVFPWALAAALLVALVYALWPRPVAPKEAMRMEMVVGDRATLAIDDSFDGSLVALTSNGHLLAYVGTDEKGVRRLYLRPMSALESTLLPSVENPLQPFFSPDNNELAFFSNGVLKRMPVTGGMPITVATDGDPRGADRSADGTILLAPDITAGLHRVPAAGGELTQVTTLGPNERTHRWPRFLPGGRAALFMVQTNEGTYDEGTIEAVTLATGERKVLVRGGTYPIYVEPGYLLFGRENAIYAVEFDPERLEVRGNAQPVVSGVVTNSAGAGAGTSNGGVQLAVANGVAIYLTYRAQSIDDLELLVLDRTGAKEIYRHPERRAFRDVRFSPDGQQLGVRVIDSRSEQLFLLDLGRGTLTQASFQGAGTLAWSRDGRRLAFMNSRDGRQQIYVGTADAPDEAVSITTDTMIRVPGEFTNDGTKLLATELNPKTQMDIVQIDLVTKAVTPVLATPDAELLPALSPDERWMAYMASLGGDPAVFVRAFRGGGGMRRASPGTGGLPIWTKNGREIVYVDLRPALTTFYAVSVTEKEGRLDLGAPVELFKFPAAQPTNSLWYHVTADGERFAVLRGGSEGTTPARRNATVVFNFVDEIKRALAR